MKPDVPLSSARDSGRSSCSARAAASCRAPCGVAPSPTHERPPTHTRTLHAVTTAVTSHTHDFADDFTFSLLPILWNETL